MSTRSNAARGRKVPKTDPKWYPTTQGINRWLNKMAERSDLTARVLKNTNGAPARYVPAEAEIDINEGLIAKIDPIIAGSPEFVVKHRAVAGACVHEAAHARWSTMIDLAKIARVHSARHASVFAMLEEGRCETQQWPYLNGVEKLALQSMVLEIVLHDMQDDEGNTPPMTMAGVIRLQGLLAARINTGIVDIKNPLSGRMHDALIMNLGADYAPLFDIAVKFSRETVSFWDSGQARMHALVEEWIAIEDRLLPPGDEPGDGPGGETDDEGDEGEPGGGGQGKGKSKSKDKGEPGKGDEPGDEDGDDGKGEGKGDEPGSKPEKSEGQGDDGDGDGEGDLPGDDDEGTVGDGSHTLSEDDAEGEASLGKYASSNVDSGTFADIFKSVREAAEEAESISGSRLREEVVAIHRATASEHAERRRRNAEAAKRWK